MRLTLLSSLISNYSFFTKSHFVIHYQLFSYLFVASHINLDYNALFFKVYTEFTFYKQNTFSYSYIPFVLFSMYTAQFTIARYLKIVFVALPVSMLIYIVVLR